MSYQVGDLASFVGFGTNPGSAPPIQVFKFWDASVVVTDQVPGTVVKRFNIGGNPAEGPGTPYRLPYEIDVCDYLGHLVSAFVGAIAVNNPPTVYGAPTVTPNNQAVPFQTQVAVSAYDLENNGV